MTTMTGQNGVVSVGSSNIAEVRGFTLDQTSDTIDASAMGDTYREYKTGMIDASGSMDLLFDTSHSASIVGEMINQAQVEVILYPGGNTSGLQSIPFNAQLTGFNMESTMDDMVSASATFQVTGAVTYATITAP